MEITVIGVNPPCPRCERLYKLTQAAVKKLDKDIEVKKISFDSEVLFLNRKRLHPL
jgi:hypothetical protein